MQNRMPAYLRTPRVLVIGAGIGGLTAALTLACDGWDVVVVERAGAAGGKLRTVESGGARIDCGPTVLTMRGIFDAIFARAGEHLDAHLKLIPAEILARHAWQDDPVSLDLYADVHRTADAIASFAGVREAQGFLGFCAAARALFESLDAPFMRADRPDMLRLAVPAARGGLAVASAPFKTLWNALGRYFADPRLRQLFGRYATYCGSSPFASPATLMLVAHAEQAGVWLVQGGMHRLAEVMADLAAARGAKFRFGAEVTAIRLEHGRARSVDLADGERIEADAVICNADCAALASGLFGDDVRRAASAPTRAGRSLSAITFALQGTAEGFPLARHNVFFSRDYRAEFDDIAARRVPRNPTVYICAQDRDAGGAIPADSGPERLFCIVNAPATGDTHTFDTSEIARSEAATFQALERCGLDAPRLARPDRHDDPQRFPRPLSGDRGRPLWISFARLDGIVSPLGRAEQDPGPLPVWRQCPSRPWPSDGGAVGHNGSSSVGGGLRVNAPAPPAVRSGGPPTV